MNFFKKILPKIFCGLLLATLFLSSTQASVSREFRANYEFQDDLDTIVNDLFVEIQAKSDLGTPISTATFDDLHDRFENVFDYLPDEFGFNVVYQQCLDLSDRLSRSYDFSILNDFMDNCFRELSRTFQRINREFSVRPSASVGPSEGAAPLTVTFDARASVDPSDQTIPSENFFRYFRDTRGRDTEIWVWPILNYQFTEPGNYVVHLTVRSSNRRSEGIIDGSETFTIRVGPKIANLVAYANGQKLSTTEDIKLSLGEGLRGIVFDGSASLAQGGRVLESSRREIEGPENFSFERTENSEPGLFRVILPRPGRYTVTLSTTDNQNNTISEEFDLLLSDPVAIIKQSPEIGSTSTEFNFDGSTSFGNTARISLYTREVFDPDGNRIQTTQWPNLTRGFSQPGNYTIKLTVQDEDGKTNIENRRLFVESSTPQANFTITPLQDQLHPSEFILDASLSSDPDIANGTDDLTFQRTFSNPDSTEIIATENQNEKIRVQFNEIGDHEITVTARDRYGKTATATQEISVESTIRARIAAAPIATTRGRPINLAVQTNKNIFSYERDLGDGTTRTTENNVIQHTFKQAGLYTVSVTTTTPDGESNETRRLVFVGEQGLPTPAFSIINQQNSLTLRQNDFCEFKENNKLIRVPAYLIDRNQRFTVDARDSVNTQGQNENLQFFFRPPNNDIFENQQGTFNFRFTELGCQSIELIVEDENALKNSKVKIRFKVTNALPELDALRISFPQFGNDSGIGFNQNAPGSEIFNTDEINPLIVQVSAQNARDPDGFISYYQRYYYDRNDPRRILEIKTSPATKASTVFSLPRVPGEFAFGVRMVDSDGGRIRSEDLIGLSPIVFFPPQEWQPDIPIVTLKIDQNTVFVDEEITFDVVAKTLIEREDFDQERFFQYDFDGDGTYDLITKKDRVTHSFSQASPEEWFQPKVAVVYRGFKGTAVGEPITVKNKLVPRILFDTDGQDIFLRNISLGDIAQTRFCLDERFCSQPQFQQNSGFELLKFSYPELSNYLLSLEITDKNGNEARRRRAVRLDESTQTGALKILSVPEFSEKNGVLEIFVGSQLDNTRAVFVDYSDDGDCYIDRDISRDTDGDQIRDNDLDAACNQTVKKSFTPVFGGTRGKIIFQENAQRKEQRFVVNFIDLEIELPADKKATLQKITDLLDFLGTGQNAESAEQFLLDLRQALVDQTEADLLVIQLENLISQNPAEFSDDATTLRHEILRELKTKTISSALGESEYEQNKSEILSLIPTTLGDELSILFDEFETASGENSRETQIKLLEEIFTKIDENTTTEIRPNSISTLDRDLIVEPALCEIADYRSLVRERCAETPQEIPDIEIPAETGSDDGDGFSLPGRLRILFRIIGLAIGGFLLLIVIFAIRARVKNKNDEEIEEFEEKTPETELIPKENPAQNSDQNSEKNAEQNPETSPENSSENSDQK